MRRALLVIDMLNDFAEEGAPLYVPDLKLIIPEVKRRIMGAHSRGEPVIYVCDAHEPGATEFNRWHLHAVRGTHGAKVVGELSPEEGDYIIEKNTYSSFLRTGLDDLLGKLEIGTIRLVGCVTNICILYTAYESSVRGYCVEVVKDGVAALDRGDGEWALRHMDNILGTRII